MKTARTQFGIVCQEGGADSYVPKSCSRDYQESESVREKSNCFGPPKLTAEPTSGCMLCHSLKAPSVFCILLSEATRAKHINKQKKKK